MFGFPFMQAIPNKFVKQYRCYSVSMLSDDKQDLEKGGKIIMPPSALDLLTRLHISYPMMFKLSNEIQERMTHCGVLEFVAQEGRVHIPYWMMENLRLNEGDLIQIESVTLPVATYAKFQPQSVDFLDITNPKAVLENTLRNFACLTKGDIIAIMYNNKRYELLVLELKPKDAVSIIECDMNVEFAPPVGYVEPQAPRPKHEEEEEITDFSDMMPQPTGFRAFACTGNRLDGKVSRVSLEPVPPPKVEYKRGIPDYDWTDDTLTFIRRAKPKVVSQAKEETTFKAFAGEGFSMRRRRE
ncbi:ubiquitin recognition factor in ER-associated degradation protein 1-like [Artemia franciscana]|uniref:Ubiquitin fusion degradation protein 1 homolog n=1 Tax=Artemia franciscana TaxID=6661 RepID=A0AA88I4M6_ARTSF|nr:hypothetical protein QYM36_002334 [Artemia franciscana]